MGSLLLMALVGQCATVSVPPDLVTAVIREESGGNPFIVRDNTTGHVHRFPSYSAALPFVKGHSRHSLDIGLMQVNTKAHRIGPEKILAPCENIREGSGILSRDLARSGQDLREALCLYHRGKTTCRDYPEKVKAFLPKPTGHKKLPDPILARRSSMSRPKGKTLPVEQASVRNLTDRTGTNGEENSGTRGDEGLDPRFRPADVDEWVGELGY